MAACYPEAMRDPFLLLWLHRTRTVLAAGVLAWLVAGSVAEGQARAVCGAEEEARRAVVADLEARASAAPACPPLVVPRVGEDDASWRARVAEVRAEHAARRLDAEHARALLLSLEGPLGDEETCLEVWRGPTSLAAAARALLPVDG